MKRILVNLTSKQLKELDKLTKKLGYRSRPEAIRDALKLLLQAETSAELRAALEKVRKYVEKQEKISVKQIEEKILSTLRKNPAGLSIQKISEITDLHRHTVRKYAIKLIAEGRVQQKKIGTVKNCMIKKNEEKA